MLSSLAKIGIFGIFILYLHLVYAQNFSLESQQFNSQGSLAFKITCIATNVDVLRWFATVDGQLLEFSRHSGIINDTYSFNKNLNWDEIGYEPPSIFQHSGTIQFDVNATILAPVTFLINRNILSISCGSSSDSISNFFILNVNDSCQIPRRKLEVFYTAVYTGLDEVLTKLTAHWKDLGSASFCNFIYIVKVNTYSEMFNIFLTSEDCFNESCTVEKLTIPNELEDDIYVAVHAIPVNGTSIFTAERIVHHSSNLLGNNIELDNCRSSITCSNLSNDSCILQYGSNSDYESFSENVTLEEDTSHMFNFTSRMQYYIQIMKRIDSINVIQRVNYNTTGNNNSNLFYIVSGYTMLGITIILQIFGYIFCIISSIITKKCDKCVYYLLLLGLCVSTLLFVLSLVLWIAYLITPTFDNCGNRLQQSSLGVSALFFFLLCAATSPVICGGFFLFIQPNKYRSYDIEGRENGVDIELTEQENEIVVPPFQQS